MVEHKKIRVEENKEQYMKKLVMAPNTLCKYVIFAKTLH